MATLKPEDPTNTTVVETAGSQTSGTATPNEKADSKTSLDLEQQGAQHAHALDEAAVRRELCLPNNAILKKSPEGIVLIPQPSDDPRDPLNWSVWKKRTVLIMLAITAFTCDFSAAIGSPAIIPQAAEWGTVPAMVNRATAGNTFMLGVGGLFTVWMSAYIGRLPVLVYMTVFAAACAIWSAAAGGLDSYTASRILNGFFVVSAAGGGLMWINDVFFFHERPRVVNAWSVAIILSPFLGPQFMAAILGVASWRVGMYLNFGVIMCALLTVLAIGEETFYPRYKKASEIPDIYAQPRWKRLLGIPQIKTNYTTNTILTAGFRTWMTATRLPVIIICVYYFFDFPWTIANNTTIAVFVVPAYQLTYHKLALLYVAPVVGGALGIPVGHFLFDFIGKVWARRPSANGIIAPEARLIPLWLVLPLKIVGYNLIGLSIEKGWNIWVLAVGWGMHNLSTILTTTAVGAYLIDAYPEASGESAAWLNFARTTAGECFESWSCCVIVSYTDLWSYARLRCWIYSD
jgi:MFS family permease